MHGDPWCNSQHFCCNCARCWFIRGTRTITCTLFSTMFASSFWWVNIVLTKDGIHTLVDIVIANPMFVNLPPQSCIIQRFVTTNVAQAKENSYCDWHPTNQFFPLANEIFRCLRKHAYVFLHDWINIICNLQEPEGLPLSILINYFHQKLSFKLQKIQGFSILNQAITVSLTTSQLPPIQATPPPPWLIYYKQLVVEMKSSWDLVCVYLTSFKFSLVFNSSWHFSNCAVFYK
jgi:hypothetical protein